MVTILKPRNPRRPTFISDEELAGTDPQTDRDEQPGGKSGKGIELSEPAPSSEGASSAPGEGPNPTSTT